ncbi:hypothetical protein FNJ62_03090 [Streptomyces benahoarensis]|uniref:Uncharacterized protein n=1 Tax=Streptomyces benahoarensis TaxID=2595054 RepID=A0A553ZQZ5_9ACTN|nr:hypothetical protein FNJ62_03090 [Streptomyces benahoarensis]TSB43890.1 hypothetical protein FNZ23_01680 [Streptomyces benahoarensis]
MAVTTMPATARAASAPPPIISQRLRRAPAWLCSASASQSGVEPDPPGPSNGPPCPKLMPRILATRCGAGAGAPTPVIRLGNMAAGGDNPVHGTCG